MEDSQKENDEGSISEGLSLFLLSFLLPLLTSSIIVKINNYRFYEAMKAASQSSAFGAIGLMIINSILVAAGFIICIILTAIVNIILYKNKRFISREIFQLLIIPGLLASRFIFGDDLVNLLRLLPGFLGIYL